MCDRKANFILFLSFSNHLRRRRRLLFAYISFIMFSSWVFYLMVNILALLFLVPCIDKSLSPLSRFTRMTMAHRLFTLRNKYLPFMSPRPPGMESDSKGFEELISLYYPRLDLSENLTNREIETLRYHSEQLLTSLHPARTSSCVIEHHIFQYDDNRVNMYSIQHNKIEDWKNSDRPLVLYLHGGGFVFGGIDTYSGFECHLSKELNMLVLHVNLRLAPESSLAKVIEDVIGVYHVLLSVDTNINQRLIGMGDSSGGMLWIYLLQWIVANNKPIPQAVVLHSPWPSLDFLGLNLMLPTDGYLSVSFLFRLRQLAIGKNNEWFEMTDEERAKFSPKENSYHGFPPLYITVGTREMFTNEIRLMAVRMKRAGVDVILDQGEGLMHTYALFHLWSIQAKCAQKRIGLWIQEQFLKNKILTSNIKIQSDTSCNKL